MYQEAKERRRSSSSLLSRPRRRRQLRVAFSQLRSAHLIEPVLLVQYIQAVTLVVIVAIDLPLFPSDVFPILSLILVTRKLYMLDTLAVSPTTIASNANETRANKVISSRAFVSRSVFGFPRELSSFLCKLRTYLRLRVLDLNLARLRLETLNLNLRLLSYTSKTLPLDL